MEYIITIETDEKYDIESIIQKALDDAGVVCTFDVEEKEV